MSYYFALIVQCVLLLSCEGKLKLLQNITFVDCNPPVCDRPKPNEVEPTLLSHLPFTIQDHNLLGFGLVDSRNKILLDWTPKAACTLSVKMFMDHMGIKEHEHYQGWVHELKLQYWYPKCGRGNVCIYEDPTWYKFKIVRNPYDRAVSSFLHIMKAPHSVPVDKLLKHISTAPSKDMISFKEYIQSMSPDKVHDFLLYNGHVRKQSFDCEYDLYKANKPPLFNRIVKLESMAADMDLVSQDTGIHFTTNFSSHHYIPRVKGEKHFVGDWPWRELRGNIPANYGHFYDAKLIHQVGRLFRQDIEMYNYSYPFDIP